MFINVTLVYQPQMRMQKSKDLLRRPRVGLGEIWDNTSPSDNWCAPKKLTMKSLYLDTVRRDKWEGYSAPSVSERMITYLSLILTRPD